MSINVPIYAALRRFNRRLGFLIKLMSDSYWYEYFVDYTTIPTSYLKHIDNLMGQL